MSIFEHMWIITFLKSGTIIFFVVSDICSFMVWISAVNERMNVYMTTKWVRANLNVCLCDTLSFVVPNMGILAFKVLLLWNYGWIAKLVDVCVFYGETLVFCHHFSRWHSLFDSFRWDCFNVVYLGMNLLWYFLVIYILFWAKVPILRWFSLE